MELFDNFSISLSQIITSAIYIIIGIIIFQIFKKALNRKTSLVKEKKEIQKITTVKTLILNVVKYIDILLVVLAVLSVFGFNVKSILAGLGIGTAILGLAFQDLAKDIIAGISIIIEGSYKVGDTIEVETFIGEVTFIGLKSTKIMDAKGRIKIISNRYMDNIINYSLHNSIVMLDVAVAYENKSDEVEKSFDEIFNNLQDKIKDRVGEFKILGVNALGDSSVIYRISVEVKPYKNIAAERIIRKEIKKVFDKNGIKIPYPQFEVHNGK